jgi:TetR/AcrR family transcriptional repressor of nem operon
MARPKEFDRDTALDAALDMFRTYGFEGTSTAMLLSAMEIGRQSFYDTFGDKLALYHAALRRYAAAEGTRHAAALQEGGRGLAAIRSMLLQVIARADQPCLGVGSICEFGRRDTTVNDINAAADTVLHRLLTERLEEAREDKTLAPGVAPEDAARFVLANVAGIRIAARGGAPASALAGIERLVMRSLT